MHDGINLSYIGLSELEIRVLRSIFTLAPQLSENYTLLPSSQVSEADLVIVNTDDPNTIRKWTEIKQANPLVSSILLTDSAKLNSEQRTIQRPIRVQKLVSALEDVVEQTSIQIETSKQERVESDLSALRVMVVDDSFPVRKYMEHKLAELVQVPFEIRFASSGEEAIGHCHKNRFDLIFLDVMMEGIDGYRACKSIKTKSDAYIVMLTSKKSPFDKVRGTMSGCDAYITKPPTDDRLQEVLGKCLAQCPHLMADFTAAAAR